MLNSLEGTNFLSMQDFSSGQLDAVLSLAADLKKKQHGQLPHPLLVGKTLAMIFQKPSLRTRVSFETGMTQLGGHAIYLAPSDIKLGQRETTEDIGIVLGRYVDIIMARVFGHDIVVDLAKDAGVPVINGLSDLEHPCQIVADLLTVLERRGTLAGLHAVYVGDGNNVAHSLMYGAAAAGMHMTIVTPSGFEPDPEVLQSSQALGQARQARIQVTDDLMSAAEGCDVLYTDVWASMGQEDEADSRRNKFMPYQLNERVVSVAHSDVVVLHCLPAHYGEEIDYATSRLANSAIFDQAENRLHAQKAIMVALSGATEA
jgi:ornithine carbamoyltransferase